MYKCAIGIITPRWNYTPGLVWSDEGRSEGAAGDGRLPKNDRAKPAHTKRHPLRARGYGRGGVPIEYADEAGEVNPWEGYVVHLHILFISIYHRVNM